VGLRGKSLENADQLIPTARIKLENRRRQYIDDI
jgi:hypothetical protein